VFDPRFPEVRDYLVGIYKQALQDWGIDGFKLDFIDDFRIYPETELEHLDGRDTLSVFEGVHRLINEIHIALQAIKSDVLIEFRQKYIGPALQPLGNMFRAFDCPNDSVMNRVRTTDVKLICGDAAVHSDMLTWHEEEPPEVAALQLTNILFSVPQISVRLSDRDDRTLKMISHWTNYWIINKDVLLDGEFRAHKPISNYPILSASSGHKMIYGLYNDVLLPLDGSYESIDIINGKLSKEVILRVDNQNKSSFQIQILDCFGSQVQAQQLTPKRNVVDLECPPNGLIKLTAPS
jgi:alpha-galactosidase